MVSRTALSSGFWQRVAILGFFLIVVPLPAAARPERAQKKRAAALAELAPHGPTARSIEAASSFALAKLLDGEGDYTGALAAFEHAVRLQPDEPYSRLELALFHTKLARISRREGQRMEHLGEAVVQADEARRLAPDNLELLSSYAHIHLFRGEHDATSLEIARKALEELRSKRPGDLQESASLAQIYLWRQDYGSAAEIVSEALDSHPNVRFLLSMALDAYLGSGDLVRAEATLERLLEVQPSLVDERLQLAELRSKRGENRGALEVLLAGSEEFREDPRGMRALAREMHLAGANEEAWELSHRLLEEFPDSPSLGRLRVSILSALARYRDALAEFEPLMTTDPDDPQFVQDAILSSRLLERIGESDDALQRLGSLIENRKTLEMGLVLSYAGTLERQSMREEAAVVLLDSAALALEAESHAEYSILVRAVSEIYQRADRVSDAQAILGEGSQRLVTAGQEVMADGLRLQQLAVLASNQHWELSRDLAQSLTSSTDRDIRVAATHQLGRVLASAGNIDEAVRLLDSSEDLSPDQATSAKIGIYFDIAQEEMGFDLLEEVVERGTPADLFFAARVLQRIERYSEMVPIVDRLVEKEPDSPQALFLLGVALERSGEVEKAEQTFGRLLEMSPDHAPALNYLGYLWADQGNNLARALELIHRAVALEPDNGAYVDSLGWAYFRLGRFDEARSHLEWAARLVPNDATIFEHLGDLYRRLNDTERARDSYRQAVNLSGGNLDTVRGKLESLDSNQSDDPSL